MDTILTFIQNRTKMLCEIYQKEQRARGHDADGVLAITLDNNEVKVAYLDYVTLESLNPVIHEELVARLLENTGNHPLAYFYVSVGPDSKLVELDINAFLG